MYIICAMIGAGILQEIMPNTTFMVNACWCMLTAILFEIIEWKHNIVEDENNG